MLAIHFIDHSQRQPDISFLDFLSMHYWGTDLNDNDTEEDQKLPFKGITTHHIHDVFTGQRIITLSLKKDFTEEKKYDLPDHTALPQDYNVVLFRPPRHAPRQA
jgi:hypothetical protein